MTFGERLQALRQREGMSQDALAERLAVSRQAVSRWERDETLPETEKVVALAELFGVTTDYLLRGTPEKAAGGPRRDWMDRLGHLVKTKGYLLGWVLIVWGALDLMSVLSMSALLHGNILAGLEGVGLQTEYDFTALFLVPVLYALVKIAAGILALRYGKKYAEKVKREGQE